MRLANPELQRLLAGRYVLGTLKGPARRRFETYLVYQPMLARAVEEWEQRLQPLADALPAVKPSEKTWRELSDRLWPQTPQASSPQIWKQLLAYCAVALFAVGLGWNLNQAELKPPPLNMAVLSSQEGVAFYMICSDPRTGRTALEVIQTTDIAADRVDQLWLLPGDGGAPRSLGLMPADGRKVIDFPPEYAALVPVAAGLAVSREPAGGSPQAGPTGPVLYTGPVRRLWQKAASAGQAAVSSDPQGDRQALQDQAMALAGLLGD